ncbi:Serine/arginine-rich splicing factor SC35 [Biomphalaria pfeifferi]|uniref:Serine/arginine-rich splicing factor SC35 n=1 Tax=Biomphalaria pfeifferi TaxID=112525 RepID=A0AAD8EZN6_BIOPF|nr:Serine/arginine-rich splicing factor SC35 [Biomphalaria pfeifferi]
MSLNRSQKDQFEVCLRNLPDRFDEESLFTLCSPYGQIVHLKVPRGDNGETKRHAYVTFATEDEAKQAIFRLDGTSVEGKEITVKLAKKTQESKER